MAEAKQTPERTLLARQTTARAYDRLSRWYDLLTGRAERLLTGTCVEMLGAKPGQRILEIGPGTGHGLVALASAVGPGGWVVGLDLSAGMLSVAQRRMARAGAEGRTNLVRGDGVHLPFGPNSFDAALMSFTLELFETTELAAVLHECARVLGPGGRMGLVAMATPARASAMSRAYALAHSRWPKVIDCRPIEVSSVLAGASLVMLEIRHTSIWGLPVALAVATVGESA